MLSSDERDPVRELLDAVARVLEAGQTAALATFISGEIPVGTKVFIERTGETTGTLTDSDINRVLVDLALKFLDSRKNVKVFSLRDAASSVEGNVLFERIEPERRIVICGAGHVGASLARLGSALGFKITLIDDRYEFVAAERFPEELIALCAAENWAQSVRDAIGNGHGISVAIVTRGHNQDEECLRAALTAQPDYVGMIGSKRRTNIVLERLRQSGIEEEKLKAVRAPIGLDIGAVTPEEVALSILAEIVAERRSGGGGSLSAWRREQVR